MRPSPLTSLCAGLFAALVLGAVSPAPALAICGDTILEAGEQCDDGNTLGGDCCSATCQFEGLGSACDADACNTGGSCDGAGTCTGTTPLVCDDGLSCNGVETCDPVQGCQSGPPGLGALFRGDIVLADPRVSDPLQDPIILVVDPITGAQDPVSVGGLLSDPRDVEVEEDRCLVVPDSDNGWVLRIDPLLYDPLDPDANQFVLAQGGDLVDPRGVAVAANGDIYVADGSPAGTILRLDPVTGAQTVVAQGGHLARSRRVAVDAAGLVYVPISEGSSQPAVVRIDPAAYDPLDPFANQTLVASGGGFAATGGPWDLDFDLLGRLFLLNAQDWNLFRIDVGAFDPLDPASNQTLVADGGSLNQTRGLALEESGHAIVTSEDPALPSVIRVDVDAFDPLDQASNQFQFSLNDLLVEPRGADVVGPGLCGNGVLDPGEGCDDGNERDGDCCSAVCQLESSGSSCDLDACTTGGTCDGAGTCSGATPVVCDDGLFCNGAESCDPALGCQAGAPPLIDDGVTCTDDSCDEANDVVVNAPNSGLCDNGLFCDGSETCDPVLDCQAGAPPTIDDGVACTVDSCDEAADVVVNAPNDGLCDNGFFCDGSETCDPTLDCQAGAPPPIDDGVACTVDSCDEAADVVVNAPNDGLCDNGLFCDGSETCDPVQDCQVGPPPTNDDGIACTDEICDEALDVVNNVPNDANCSDGLVCNGVETCDPVLDCQGGPPGLGALFRGDIVVADARLSDPLQDPFIAVVDPVTGDQEPLSEGGFLADPRDVEVEGDRCLVVPDSVNRWVVRVDPLLYDPLDPGANQVVLAQGGNLLDPRGVTVAASGDIYVADRSFPGSLLRIDPLTGDQTVVASGGFIERPRRVTVDAAGLLYVPVHEGAAAPSVVRVDPNAYDPLDPFANQTIVASDGGFAPSGGPWDADFDLLGRLFLLNAQDWNLFRIDVGAFDPLDPASNQTLVADGGSLNQTRGLAIEESGQALITREDASLPAVIRVDVDAFDPLDPASNQLQLSTNDLLVEPRGADVVGPGLCGNGVLDPGEGCDDGNEQGGDCCSAVCQFESSGSSCDLDACTTGGTCDGAGTCSGATPVVCDDGLFCNGAESCDPALGCQAGIPPILDDGVTCTDDSCDEAADVVVNAPNSGLCDNGLFCDGSETCDPVLDCQAGAPPTIDDGVACTVDSCDEAADVVVNAPNDGLCDNGLFCDGSETCDPVLDCQAGAPPPIDDGVACTVDSCDEVADVVVNAPSDGLCDNGLFCDGSETCDPVQDCQVGPPPTNDDGIACTDEICDEALDVVNNVPNDANCSDGLVCNGVETCDPVLDCQAGPPGLGALFRGDIVIADPRSSDPLQDPFIAVVDPVTGDQEPLSEGGFLADPRDVEVEGDRCLVVPDSVNRWVVRVDPLLYDPLDPGANQVVLAQGGDLLDPRGVTVAASGDIYVADRSFPGSLLRIDPLTGDQTVVARGGFIERPRRVTVDAAGLLYVPVHEGASSPSIVRVDPNAYDPLDPFANQTIVASDGGFAPSGGPWDADFDLLGRLFLVNAQDWNLFRIDVGAYDPLDPAANQTLVSDGGNFVEIRGVAVEESGRVLVTNEGGAFPSVIRVDSDAFDPLDPASNQVQLSTNDLLVEPRGADVVGPGLCGNGVLDPGEGCDDGNEQGGDCCSAVCQLESSGSSCDLDACTTGGTCDGAGTCAGGTPVVCDNGLFCDGAESCDPVLGCQAGAPPFIDDGVTCTDDSCDEVNDVVVNAPNNGLCDNGLFCDGAETCDPVLDCQSGVPPPIDDGVACTVDSCDEAADVVVNAPNNGLCDNGLFCDGSETCDPVQGCQAGAPPTNDDGIACTDEICDEALDVVNNVPNDANCDNGLFCDGAETCDPVQDCQAGTPPTNDDGIACTDEICDEALDVVNNVPNDTNCDNGLFCDGAETCDPVLDCQLGTPPSIDDGVACTDDSCDETLDVVVNAPNDGLCDNGLFCDGPEVCDPVQDCQAGAPPPIDDGVDCTDDSCDEANDVVVNDPNDASCPDDGDICTVGVCDAIQGCMQEPIPGCTPPVPALPLWARALLIALLGLGGALSAQRWRARTETGRA